MAKAKQSAQGYRGLRNADVTLFFADTKPACAEPDVDPAWWDLETHTHASPGSCHQCRNAVAVCAECPLWTGCAKLGRAERFPCLIYAGRVWGTNGRPMASCRWCQAPLVGPGRQRASGTCSTRCERNHDEATSALVGQRR